MSSPNSSTDDAVRSIFRVFEAFYGSARMARMWGEQDPGELVGYWVQQLDGVQRAAIQYALNHLPESMPPTVGEFRRLCTQWTPPAAPQLEAPRMSRKETAKRAEIERQAAAAIRPRRGTEWAAAILELAKRERVPIAHVQMAKRALGMLP